MAGMMMNPMAMMKMASTAANASGMVSKGSNEYFWLYVIFGMLLGCVLMLTYQLFIRDNSTMSSDTVYGLNIFSAICSGLMSCSVMAFIVSMW